MHGTGQRKPAAGTCTKSGLGAAGTVAEPGCPPRRPPGAWHKGCPGHGEARPPKRQREPRLALETGQAAVGCCLAHGKRPLSAIFLQGWEVRVRGHSHLGPLSAIFLQGWEVRVRGHSHLGSLHDPNPAPSKSAGREDELTHRRPNQDLVSAGVRGVGTHRSRPCR